MLFSKLIKLAEQSGKELDNLLRIFNTVAVSRKSNHVSVEKRNVVQDVNDSLIILNSSENVVGDQFRQ